VSGGASPTYAAVAVPIPIRRLFTYEVPEALRAQLRRGVRVRIPFARRTLLGTVVEWPAPAPPAGIAVKPLAAVLDEAPSAGEELLELTRFVADYYLCSWGEALEAALPGGPSGRATVRFARRLPHASADALPARATSPRCALTRLPEDGALVPIAGFTPAERRGLLALVRQGLAVTAADADDAPAAATAAAEQGPVPTPAQRSVLTQVSHAIAAKSWKPFLLFGATGSGKTEVYLRAAAEALAQGRGVLYLVPEISLTPLLAERVARRFPGQVAVLHSGMGARERFAAWKLVRDGRRRFVLGARSAIFAPLRELGLLVVDEEQDASYKQQDVPRYNARDLAVVRSRSASAVLLLGSATPSLESYHHAKSGRYTLLELGGRVESRPLPAVRIVDMRAEFQRTGKQKPLSRILIEALRGCVERGEQALVLRNRRGWAPAVFCPTCGTRVGCPRCSVTLTWHEAARRLRCHYCLFETTWPALCAACGAAELKVLGEGSERIEHELRGVLPSSARIARMDRDTMRRRGAPAELLGKFARHEIDVIVGTQMIAKGHDFPNVTLVGVLSADQTLSLPDFRAAERAFQLLTQVEGRAGRGNVPGSVIVQAFDPSHPVLAEAGAHDFESFYAREIRYRRALRYPPLTSMVQILVSDKDPARASGWSAAIADALTAAGEGRLLIAGPGKAPIERLKGQHRRQILARSAGRRRLVAAVDRALRQVEGQVPQRAVHIDVDPVSLL